MAFFTENNILIIIGVLLAISTFFFNTIKIVPQSEEWTLERFGRFTKILKPGIHFITPFIERIGVRISRREHVLDISPQDVISADNVMVKVDGVVFYRAFDTQKAAYGVANLRRAIAQLTMTNIRTLLGEMQLDEMLSNREALKVKLLAIVDEATDPWGIKVTRVELKDIHPSKKDQDIMASQMRAEREKRALVLEAEGLRRSTIMKAEAEKESKIRVAEGERDAIMLAAEAAKEKAFREAEALERTGEAKAKALAMISKVITTDSGKAASYFLSEQYIKSLGNLAGSQASKTIFMPFEASKLLSSVGTFGALAKELLKDDKSREE
ncbi:MAG: SPFH domain-containing protein [Cytophagales bacterium]